MDCLGSECVPPHHEATSMPSLPTSSFWPQLQTWQLGRVGRVHGRSWKYWHAEATSKCRLSDKAVSVTLSSYLCDYAQHAGSVQNLAQLETCTSPMYVLVGVTQIHLPHGNSTQSTLWGSLRLEAACRFTRHDLATRSFRDFPLPNMSKRSPAMPSHIP